MNERKQNAKDKNKNKIRKDSSKIKIDLKGKEIEEWENKQENLVVPNSRKTIYSKLHNSQEFPNWRYVALSNIFDGWLPREIILTQKSETLEQTKRPNPKCKKND